jgi:hypothetical protein
VSTSFPDQSPIEIVINTTLKQALTIDRPVDKTSSDDSDNPADTDDVTADDIDINLPKDAAVKTMKSNSSDKAANRINTHITADKSASDTQESTIVSTRHHLAVAGALIRTISPTTDLNLTESNAQTSVFEDGGSHDTSPLSIETDAEKVPISNAEADTNMNTDRTATMLGESLLSALLTSTLIAYALDSSMNHATDPWNPSSLDFYGMSDLSPSDQSLFIITGAVAACRRFDVEVKTVATRAQIPYETLTKYLQKSE